VLCILSGSWIWDPGLSTRQQKRGGGGGFVVLPFFVATNFTKLKKISFKQAQKKIGANERRIKVPQQLSLGLKI
jgi:hypothetical protein